MENFLCALDEDFFDFYDTSIEYSDSLDPDSPYSNESDQENQFFNFKVDQPYKLKRPHGVKKIQQRKAANQRERRRMKSINDAFDNLRQCIPSSLNAERRLSKVDTLRLAIRYISYLSELVQSCSDYSSESPASKKPRTQEKVILRWNFTDPSDQSNEQMNLVGHSLSWSNEKPANQTADNKFTAKIWTPEVPTAADLMVLNSYSNDYQEFI
ncbi:hypothetical protein FSP39_009214 [Pinctada imbricata]|uniref:BHLH domain-containing protein n=1 Tax=Pinctada imbricata TaxID=66713 RepID=A0AA88YWU0_PINIB|nr:hypothetical protein FSP39_009214 [Pinctada imbricata]